MLSRLIAAIKLCNIFFPNNNNKKLQRIIINGSALRIIKDLRAYDVSARECTSNISTEDSRNTLGGVVRVVCARQRTFLLKRPNKQQLELSTVSLARATKEERREKGRDPARRGESGKERRSQGSRRGAYALKSDTRWLRARARARAFPSARIPEIKQSVAGYNVNITEGGNTAGVEEGDNELAP